jgi:hypothetical protein
MELWRHGNGEGGEERSGAEYGIGAWRVEEAPLTHVVVTVLHILVNATSDENMTAQSNQSIHLTSDGNGMGVAIFIHSIHLHTHCK